MHSGVWTPGPLLTSDSEGCISDSERAHFWTKTIQIIGIVNNSILAVESALNNRWISLIFETLQAL